jgi:hypothetical protein
MKIRIALLAVCAGMFFVAQADVALAVQDPIPGVDIVVRKCTTNCPKAKPGAPAKPKQAITTSRSNIKHNGQSP